MAGARLDIKATLLPDTNTERTGKMEPSLSTAAKACVRSLVQRCCRWDTLIVLLLVMGALLIRIGFLAEYPYSIFHEDSGPYVDEAERLLEGRQTANGLPGRPLGYPIFLMATISLLSPDLIHTVALQHVLSVVSVLLLTFALRMMGVNRLLSYLFFIVAAFSHRLIHYDNTIGGETLTVFLMALSFFIMCGMALRRWNPWVASTLLGVICAYMLLVRTGSFFVPLLYAAMLALPFARSIHPNLGRRALLMALIVLPTVVLGYSMIQWNKTHYGRATLSREVKPVMAFVIGYSVNLDGGIYPEIKRELRAPVEAGRARLTENGYTDKNGDNDYQWVFSTLNPMDKSRVGSQEIEDRIISSLFWETLLTPETLWRHLSGHVWRELNFMLFDKTATANSVYSPRVYLYFTQRDAKSLRIAFVRDDIVPGTLIANTIPGVMGELLQRFTTRYISLKYHTEYKKKPGMIRVYAIPALVLLLFLLFSLLNGWNALVWLGDRLRVFVLAPRRIRDGLVGLGSRTHPLPARHAMALLASGIWLGNALLYSTLLYALHRYSYYVLTFLVFTAVYGLSLILERLRESPDARTGR